MEPRIAVYRIRDDKTGQAKFGHIWMKTHTKALETIHEKKLVDKGESLDGVWTSDWREPTSEYVTIFGEDLEPELDYAKNLRERLLKKAGTNKGMSKKQRLKQIQDALKSWTDPTCATGTCGTPSKSTNKYVDKGIEAMSTSPSPTGYQAPYNIVYAPENGL